MATARHDSSTSPQTDAGIWRDWGGSGPTLHFAHANGFPPETYRKLIGELARNHHVCSMSARPLWPDVQPPTLPSWTLLAEDLAKLRHKPRVYISHNKPGAEQIIFAECQAAINGLEIHPLSGDDRITL